ncbi:DUF732 domain-containing protein [Cellulosimicrobium cellulans]|uniref:DUF732 domain-containing protein n=1 Tax=Cellulosimicrobium cellulans TaxID=1710 RepID=UPI0014772B4C|nr:DUF732 domain-containing protein [Cellulosimicrobium cellulans]
MLLAAVVVGLVVTGCGTSEDDERYLAIVDELLGQNSDIEFPRDDILAAGHGVCAKAGDDDPDRWLSDATDHVAKTLDTDDFTAQVLALGAAQVYCPQKVPRDLLYPSDS